MRWALPQKHVALKYREGNKNPEHSNQEKVSNVDRMLCSWSGKAE